MKQRRPFSIRDRVRSFRYAFNGFAILFREEHNARIHAVAAIGAIALGLYQSISPNEWLWIALSIALVFLTEILNSAIENMCDGISTSHQSWIKKAKDLSAAAVLVAAAFALFVALQIFVIS